MHSFIAMTAEQTCFVSSSYPTLCSPQCFSTISPSHLWQVTTNFLQCFFTTSPSRLREVTIEFLPCFYTTYSSYLQQVTIWLFTVFLPHTPNSLAGGYHPHFSNSSAVGYQWLFTVFLHHVSISSAGGCLWLFTVLFCFCFFVCLMCTVYACNS